jgi:hypothetical protein
MYYSEHVTVQSSNAEEAKLRKPPIRLTSPKSKAVLNHVMNITPVKFRVAPEMAF